MLGTVLSSLHVGSCLLHARIFCDGGAHYPCSADADTGAPKLSELPGRCMERNQLRPEHPGLLVSY